MKKARDDHSDARAATAAAAAARDAALQEVAAAQARCAAQEAAQAAALTAVSDLSAELSRLHAAQVRSCVPILMSQSLGDCTGAGMSTHKMTISDCMLVEEWTRRPRAAACQVIAKQVLDNAQRNYGLFQQVCGDGEPRTCYSYIQRR